MRQGFRAAGKGASGPTRWNRRVTSTAGRRRRRGGALLSARKATATGRCMAMKVKAVMVVMHHLARATTATRFGMRKNEVKCGGQQARTAAISIAVGGGAVNRTEAHNAGSIIKPLQPLTCEIRQDKPKGARAGIWTAILIERTARLKRALTRTPVHCPRSLSPPILSSPPSSLRILFLTLP